MPPWRRRGGRSWICLWASQCNHFQYMQHHLYHIKQFRSKVTFWKTWVFPVITCLSVPSHRCIFGYWMKNKNTRGRLIWEQLEWWQTIQLSLRSFYTIIQHKGRKQRKFSQNRLWAKDFLRLKKKKSSIRRSFCLKDVIGWSITLLSSCYLM